MVRNFVPVYHDYLSFIITIQCPSSCCALEREHSFSKIICSYCTSTKQGCVCYQVCYLQTLTVDDFDEPLPITFVFFIPYPGLAGDTGMDIDQASRARRDFVFVFVCQIHPLEPLVHRELPLTNYICQSSRTMPIDA